MAYQLLYVACHNLYIYAHFSMLYANSNVCCINIHMWYADIHACYSKIHPWYATFHTWHVIICVWYVEIHACHINIHVCYAKISIFVDSCIPLASCLLSFMLYQHLYVICQHKNLCGIKNCQRVNMTDNEKLSSLSSSLCSHLKIITCIIERMLGVHFPRSVSARIVSP